MLDNSISSAFFDLTSKLTAQFPKEGAWLFDHTLIPAIGNKLVKRLSERHNLRIVRSVPSFQRILVISDIHIGDSILAAGGVSAFRDYFPDARIDYVVKRSVACLFEGNSEISHLYPVFTGDRFPDRADLEAVQKLVRENQYDLYLNCCPFIENKQITPGGRKVLNMVTAAPSVLLNLTRDEGYCHFMYQTYDLPGNLLRRVADKKRSGAFTGFPVTLSDGAYEQAQKFLVENQVPRDQHLFFLNPDTASRYNRMRFEHQLTLLRGLLALGGHVLLGSGFTAKDIERRLEERLTGEERSRLTIVPKTLALDAYAALVDSADIFISGDTGPLHIAAARKVSKSGNIRFRNRTFVVSVFGATNARMSGYDSTDPRFPPADQNAPSRCYVSESSCRNITCMNKMAKTCEEVRCFESLNVEKILSDIRLHLKWSYR